MKSMSDDLSLFVSDIIKKIVDKPDLVEVDCIISTKSIILQVKADLSDYGKIIGRSGKTIESIKILTVAIKNTNFNKDSRRIYIEVIEDENNLQKK